MTVKGKGCCCTREHGFFYSLLGRIRRRDSGVTVALSILIVCDSRFLLLSCVCYLVFYLLLVFLHHGLSVLTSSLVFSTFVLVVAVVVLTEEPEVFVPSNSAQQSAVSTASSVPVVMQSAQPQAAYAQPVAVAPAAQPQVVASGPVSLPGLGKDPKRITCPYCQQSTVTNVSNEIDACTIVAVVVLLLVFWPVFWIRKYSTETDCLC